MGRTRGAPRALAGNGTEPLTLCVCVCVCVCVGLCAYVIHTQACAEPRGGMTWVKEWQVREIVRVP